MKLAEREVFAGKRSDGTQVYFSLRKVRNIYRMNKVKSQIRSVIEVAKYLKEKSAPA